MSRKRKKPSGRPGVQRQKVAGTARASAPFRLTLEQWAQDASVPVAELEEQVEVLIRKGWIVRLAPDVWVLTIPEGVAVK